MRTCEYYEGVLNGVCIVYSGDKVQSETYYKNGTWHGSRKTWNRGVLATEENYMDGKREGLFREWNWNGNIKFECNYKDDKKHGSCKSWDSDGKIMSNKLYENGNIIEK